MFFSTALRHSSTSAVGYVESSISAFLNLFKPPMVSVWFLRLGNNEAKGSLFLARAHGHRAATRLSLRGRESTFFERLGI